MQVRRGAWYAAGIFAALGGVAAGGVSYLGTTQVDPVRQHNESIQRQFASDYRDDLEFVQAEPFFATSRQGTADASEFLNRQLTWLPKPPTAGPKPLIDAALLNKILRLRNDWIEHYGSFRRVLPDFSLLRELLRYDFWDLERNGPLDALVASGAFVPPSELPAPDSMELAALVKLRLMKATEGGEWLAALRECRHVARLMFSTESLQLQLAGLALLDIERRAYRHYVEHNMIDEAAWQPIDRNFTRRASRAIWATRGYLRLLTPGDLFQQALLDPKRDPIGLCAAANESYPIEWSLKPLLDGRWPGQVDLRANYARLDQAWERARGRCRLRYLEALRASGKIDPSLPVPFLFRAFPWSRQLFGLKLSTLNFVGFEAYESARP
jgi:hypothetical protein